MRLNKFLRIVNRLAEESPDECWIWPLSHRNGYGCAQIDGGKVLATHRVTFELFVRPLAPGEVVCHRCDNPSCLRPDHLFAGTQRENMRDCVAKGRIAGAKMTHCKRGHPLEGDNVRWRKRYATGQVYRQCRTCLVEGDRRRTPVEKRREYWRNAYYKAKARQSLSSK